MAMEIQIPPSETITAQLYHRLAVTITEFNFSWDGNWPSGEMG